MLRNLFLILLISVISFSQNACSQDSEKKEESSKQTIELKNLKDSASYALGVNIVQNLKRQKMTERINQEIFISALKAQLENEKNLMDNKTTNTVIRNFMSQKSQKDNAGKLKKGKKFLKENAKKEGVNVTESGLQYKVINEGTGEKPSAKSKVKVHYEGRLIDGTVFDSSYERGEPTEFPVNRVIKGWQEGLQMMKEGAKWKMYIPYNLAYGERGQGKQIGPYETLIFDVELLEIVE